MKTAIKIGAALVVVLVVGVWLRGRMELRVPVAAAVEGTAVNAVTGTVEVWANVDIRLKVKHRGTVNAHHVVAGEVVEPGQLLVTQDSADLDLLVEQVEIRLEAARKRAALLSPLVLDLKTIEEEIESTQLAVELRQSPESALERVLREKEKKEIYLSLEGIQQRETVKLLELQLAQYALQREEMEVRAPFGGRIVSFSAFPGDLLHGGQEVLRILSHGRYVLMELTEEDYFGVENEQKVTLRLASYPDRTFEGRVVRLEDAANASEKTRNLIVMVEAPDEVLVPGLTGEGYLVKGERSGSVLVPRRALIGNLLWVVEGDRVEIRQVEPGYRGLRQVEIREGLAVGERVVLENQNLLKAGDRVEVEAVTGR